MSCFVHFDDLVIGTNNINYTVFLVSCILFEIKCYIYSVFISSRLYLIFISSKHYFIIISSIYYLR